MDESERCHDKNIAGLGSVAAVTDPSGNVAANYQYDPYGNVTSQTGTIYNPFQYASGWQSNITNFTHFSQRWYAPTPFYGRWTQQDPVAGSLGNPISQCRYAYANNDPVNLTDRSGAISLACGLALVGTGVDLLALTGIFGPFGFFLSAGIGVAATVAGLAETPTAANAFTSVGSLALGLNFAALAEISLAAALGGVGVDVLGTVLACSGV